MLQVEWIPARSAHHGGGAYLIPRSSVRVSAFPLPAADREAARDALWRYALPELVGWIENARHSSATWRTARHTRSWRLAGNATVSRDDWQPYPLRRTAG
ncbi:hypothetical protein F7Q99_27530 [Streptomyces kaniharaensis]|uniref:Uncharacterized protein n=1 Tax=Streptomyces kaniharaensis TaxID=212423 RepID=A0A6N7KW81_9ACTN|nr:hypothetical protein [Streptomyces kaniharaensis]MQS15906.1 hypothetical protein [Streptomyces kaniharaensis]